MRVGLRELKRIASNLPAPAKRAAQAGVSAVDPVAVRRYRRRHAVSEPIPPVALRARVGCPEIGAFMASGRDYIALMERMLDVSGKRMSDFESVLDFGCGCGRTLVPLWRHWGDDTSFHGCDIDDGAIEWLRAEYPALPVEVNSFHPPLPYEPASFDLVYSVSVFTHLDEEAQFAWLDELVRVLRPGGLAMLTIHGERAHRAFSSGERVGAIHGAAERVGAHSLESAGYFYEPAEPSRWNALQFMDDSDSWGLAFHSDGYVRERWSHHFASVDIVPGDGAQDVVLARV